jgi:two-component system, OmpR family, response regulator
MFVAERSTRVLIVDSDAELRSRLAGYLEQYHMTVTPVANGDSMWTALRRQMIDLVILEVDLQNADGLSLCRLLRVSSQVPIMLTGRVGHTAAIEGFEFGADAYVAKPYDMREILVRAKAILRRTKAIVRTPFQAGVRTYRFSGWTLDGMSHELYHPNAERLRLSRGEYRLLATLLANPSVVLKREVLSQATAGPGDRSIDGFVSRLRSMLREDARSPRIIKTVHGEGYMIAVAVEALNSHTG